ncbi:Tfp pilus assembly protein PilN [Variovorax sp. GrIS 2.14]|uniref:hypothetical protein n=1 Tax=Variovorax sp. GrIS 2.14 TaxID=3071709 RepID=UPI0038F73696
MLQLSIDAVATLAILYFFGSMWAGIAVLVGVICWLAGSFVKSQNERIAELQKQVIALTNERAG